MSKATLLFLVTEDWYFLSHRLAMARAARAAGFEVVVLARDSGAGSRIETAGFRFVPIRLDRLGLNPVRDCGALMELIRIYRRESPGVVHHVGLKPVLYGTIAAGRARVPHVINALAGFGFVFTSSRMLARLLRPLVRRWLRLSLGRPGNVVLLQNQDAAAIAERLGLAPKDNIQIVPGSGVDTEALAPVPEPDGMPVVALVARMLWSKGIAEFVAAARLLKERGVAVRLALVGGLDPGNPDSVSEAELARWQADDLIEWWGHRPDIGDVWKAAHIAALPSHAEGMPKALLEAGACGRPLIGCDEPGARTLIREGTDGLLVPVGDAVALADAIEALATDPDRRRTMGKAARTRVVGSFSERVVEAAMLTLYRALRDDAEAA